MAGAPMAHLDCLGPDEFVQDVFLDSDTDRMVKGRALATWSLVFWAGAITAGRLLAYIRLVVRRTQVLPFSVAIASMSFT